MLIRSTEYVAIALKDFHENLRAYSATDRFRIEIIPAQHEQILFEPAVEDVARLVKSFSDVCNKGRGRDARLSDPLLRPSDEIVGTR